MDYERDAGGDGGQQPDASEIPMDGQTPTTGDEVPTTGDEAPATDAGMATADETVRTDGTTADAPNVNADMPAAATQAETPATDDSDFGADADVMNDSFENHEAAPPEWPAADFAASGDALEPDANSDESTAATEIAATYAAATEEPSDVGDDSDAPILADATGDATTASAPDAATPQSYIQADNVTLKQAGAQTIQASTVTVTQGGAGQVHADSVSVEQGGLGLARTKTLTLGTGASAFAVIADEATVEEGSQTFLVVSRTFNGDVQPTIDWRVAAAFGAGLGLALSILRRIR